jgi:hypothetical protein
MCDLTLLGTETKNSGYRMKLPVRLRDAKEKSLHDYATT